MNRSGKRGGREKEKEERRTHESIDEHLLLLTIPMDPSHRLKIGRGVPVAVKHDEPRCADEIKARSARFRGQEEDEAVGLRAFVEPGGREGRAER
jgi:hypothetical protein